ncbi:MAG: metallopeptidase family protein [Minisyncoccia bacterium]
MTKEEFETIISQSLEAFPKRFKEKMKNVAVTLQAEPDDFQKQQSGYSNGEYLLGLYEGVPQTQRYHYDKAVPDKITLFQNNIEKIANFDSQAIKQLVNETLWHEIGHHFGMNETEVRNFINHKFKH